MPQPTRQPPPDQSPATGAAAAAIGAATVPTLGAIAAGGLGPGAALAAGATGAAALGAAALAAVLAAMRRRAKGARAWVLSVVAGEFPDEPRDLIEELLDDEALREVEFQRRVEARVRKDLARMVTMSAEEFEEAFRQLIAREGRFAVAREQAMLGRAIGAVEAMRLQRESPQGAYWKLSPDVREHTLDCLAVGEQFWPWSILVEHHPPVHHGCACSLVSLQDAVAAGLMSPSQILAPDAAHRKWNGLMDGLELDEAAVPADVLTEAAVHTGVMVALYPDKATAKAMAVSEGEDPSELHVTLAFLGDSKDLKDTAALREVVAGFARTCPPLTGSVSGTGLFTAGPDPVLYASVDVPLLPAHRERLVAAMTAAGLPVSKTHGFTPHMTLAYDDRQHRVANRKLRFGAVSLVIGGNRTDFDLTGNELQEARVHRLRYGKGLVKGGEFRPTRGGSSASVRDRVPMGGRGKWTWVAGRYRQVPELERWEHTAHGREYVSPPGTTNVYRDGRPINADAERRVRPVALASPGSEPIRDTAEVVRAEVRDPLIARAAQAAERPRPGRVPIRPGDSVAALGALRDAGFRQVAVTPKAGGGYTADYEHDGGRLRVAYADTIEDVEWDDVPPPSAVRTKSDGPAASFDAHAADALAWADELGERFGASVHATEVRSSDDMADHSGLHFFDGTINLGKDVRRDMDAAGAARAAGRPLTDREAAGVWASMWVTGHEIGHGVNPIDPALWYGAHADLEEALTEELAHDLAVTRLTSQGQQDVLDWRAANPDAVSVKGAYLSKRAALRDVLDRAGVPAAERHDVMRDLKFRQDPGARIAALAGMIDGGTPESMAYVTDRMTSHTPAAPYKASPGLWDDLKGGFADYAKATGKPKAKPSMKPAPIGSKKPAYTPGPKKDPPPPIPPKYVGGEGENSDGPIPSFDGTVLTIKDKPGDGWKVATDEAGNKYFVDTHASSGHVASQVLANAIYRDLDVPVVKTGTVSVSEPDFTSIPDVPLDNDGPIDAGTKRVSTGIVVQEPDGRVWIYEPRNHFGGYQHTFPKGGVEDDLTRQQNAHKELWEETGLHAQIVGVVGDYAGDTSVTRYYRGVRTGGEPTIGAETQAVKLVSAEEAASLLNKDRDKDILADWDAEPKVPEAEAKAMPDAFPADTLRQAVVTEAAGKISPVNKPSEAFSQDYMADALLGNWDLTNVTWDDGMPVRVGQESALGYRADGSPKPFGPVPTEVWTLKGPKGKGYGKVDLSEEDMRVQAGNVVLGLPPERVDELVDAAPFTDEDEREEIREALHGRLDWMTEFAAGDTDLPGPLEGGELAGVMADAQAKLKLHTGEIDAVETFLSDSSDVNAHLRSGRPKNEASDEVQATIKQLDGLLAYVKPLEDDAYVYAPLAMKPERAADPKLGGLLGKTFEEKGFLPTTVAADPAAGGSAVMRVLLPAGTRVAHMQHLPGVADDVPATPEVVLPRGQRFRIVARRVENGNVVVDVVATPKPKGNTWTS